VMGRLEGETDIMLRAEWEAFGDSGSWTIPADENGSATIAAWVGGD